MRSWQTAQARSALARAAIVVWRLFADLDLTESKKTSFASLRDCFTRELRAGARPLDGDARPVLFLAQEAILHADVRRRAVRRRPPRSRPP